MDIKRRREERPTTGNRLLAWRQRMGFTQVEASQAIGCSRAAWQYWEAGYRPVPRYIGLACDAITDRAGALG